MIKIIGIGDSGRRAIKWLSVNGVRGADLILIMNKHELAMQRAEILKRENDIRKELDRGRVVVMTNRSEHNQRVEIIKEETNIQKRLDRTKMVFAVCSDQKDIRKIKTKVLITSVLSLSNFKNRNGIASFFKEISKPGRNSHALLLADSPAIRKLFGNTVRAQAETIGTFLKTLVEGTA